MRVEYWGQSPSIFLEFKHIGHGGGSWIALLALSVLATSLTLLMCTMSHQLGNATQLIDRADSVRKLHAHDTPLVGGLAMMLPTLVLSLLYMLMFHGAPYLNAAVFASSLVLCMGVIDDRLGISPAWRFVGLFFAVVVAFSVEPLFVIRTISLAILGWHIAIPLHSLAAPITLLIIVGFVNAVNLADGMNGQLLGSVMIWAALLMHYIGPGGTAPIAALFCTAAVTLVFNLRGKLFTGSAGAYSAALFVALCTIAIYRSTPSKLAAETVVLWFWLPVTDCLRLIFVRMRALRSPFEGDRNHVHHFLLALMPPRYALAAYLALMGLPALAAEINPWLGQIVFLGCVVVYFTLVAGKLGATGKLRTSKPTTVNAAE